jgi:hypothetical protein
VKLNLLQEENVAKTLINLGAKPPLLHELTDHWCVQINLEMEYDLSFEDALQKVYLSKKEETLILIKEIEIIKFPHTVSPLLLKTVGYFSIVILVVGIILRISKTLPPFGLLLPGYILTTFFFLPLWLLKKLQSKIDKVKIILQFLLAASSIHLLIFWLNNSVGKWIAMLCCIFILTLQLFYFLKTKNRF